MDFLQPDSLAAALELRAGRSGAVPLSGGTDVMVDLTFDRRDPDAVLDLTRVPELAGIVELDGGVLRLGAHTTCTTIERELAERLPALATAARTVGSPQVRNRATIGGNLGTASPASDLLPPLVAGGATVEVASAARGTRMVDAAGWVVAPKRSALADDELVVAVHVPIATGPQRFAKVGARNAMVISIAGLALVVDRAGDVAALRVGAAIGSAGPTIISATDATALVEAEAVARGGWGVGGALDEPTLARFGELVAAAARPIDDVRGTAAYRRHALDVIARRTLAWAWSD